MTKRAIVIAGLVRTPERLQPFLGDLLPFAADRGIEIIFSTWKGELDKYPEISSQLANSKGTIIEQDEPDLIVHGHVVHQIQSLCAGLALLDDGVFVQRLRPDFATMNDVEAFCRQEPESISDDVRIRQPFRHRIYVSGCILAHPFYINDMCFAGMVGDLRHITEVPVTYWTVYTRLAPEQLIWGSPAIWMNPVFDAYFRANLGLIFNDPANSAGSIEAMKGSEIYQSALAAYLHFLAKVFFNLRAEPPLAKVAEQCAPFTLEEILWSEINPAWGKSHALSNTTHVSNLNAARAVCAGHFRSSEFGDRVLAAVKTLESAELDPVIARSEKDQFVSGSRLLADAFDANTNVHGFKVFRPIGNRLLIGGMRPQWRVVGERSRHELELEGQVNQLRRTVEALSGKRLPNQENLAIAEPNQEQPAAPLLSTRSVGSAALQTQRRTAADAGAGGLVGDLFHIDLLLGAQPDLSLSGFESAETWRGWLAARPWLGARFYIDACLHHAEANGVSSLWLTSVAPEDMDVIKNEAQAEVMARRLAQGPRALLDLVAAMRGSKDARSMRIYADEALSDWALALRGRFPRFVGSEPTTIKETAGDLFPIQLEDPQRLSYPDGCFDLVLTRNVGAKAQSHLRELSRMLQPGGLMLACNGADFEREGIQRQNTKVESVAYGFQDDEPPAPGNDALAPSSLEPDWALLNAVRKAGFSRAEFVFYSSKIGGLVSRNVAGVWIMLAVR